MNNIKIWPHLTIVAILCAVLAGAGVALYLKHERSAEAAALPNAARIQRVDGEVALNNSLDPAFANNEANAQSNNDANTQWVAAAPNQPFSVGDRIYTRDNSRASLAFTGRNYVRLEPNTGLDVLTLQERRTQLALRDGEAMFDLGYLEPGEVFEVATPYGAVNFDQPGLYNVGLNNGSAIVSVLSGLAQVVGLGGSGQINKGEMLTLLGQTAAQVVLSRLNRGNAGSMVDNYYRQQYPNNYDGRYSNYDTYLNDPFYYDPYRSNASYQHVTSVIPGINDLDSYGDWQTVDGYGYAWQPRVEQGWAPYQQGQWVNDYPYGPTWVSTEPWGYAPYHYGRWANVNNQWYWIPEQVNTTPQYSPALVAFVPLNGDNQIGWVPLAPGDTYAPRYYDENWQPYYLSSNAVVPAKLINLAVPGAVTVVPLQDFTRVIDRRMLVPTTPQSLAQVRPTLDPLTLTPLRNAVAHSAWGRGKISLPPGIAKKLYETSVVTNATPFAPHSKKDLAKVWKTERVSDKVKGQKFDVQDNRQGEEVRHAARKQEINAPVVEGAKANKEARQQQHDFEKQQRKQQAEQARTVRQATPQAQGQRVAQPMPKLRDEKHERKQQERPAAAPPEMQQQAVPHGNGGKHGGSDKPEGGGGKGKGKGKP